MIGLDNLLRKLRGDLSFFSHENQGVWRKENPAAMVYTVALAYDCTRLSMSRPRSQGVCHVGS